MKLALRTSVSGMVGLLLLMSAWVQANDGFSITLGSKSQSQLSSAQREALSKFFQEAEQKLPTQLKQRLARKIEVEFQKLDSDAVLGQAKRDFWNPRKSYRIEMSHLFLSEIEAGERTSRRYRMAIATLLHEIGHLYDFADISSAETISERERCQAFVKEIRRTDRRCMLVAKRDRTLSQDSRLQTLLGFSEMGTVAPSRRRDEVVSMRTPDAYEFRNPEEGYAVNLEYFLTDPEFACRRPSVHAFFVEHFGEDPFPGRDCRTRFSVPMSSARIDSQALRFIDLDPARVYQVHYLFASQGQMMMSRWGHAMYRLVVCAPQRAVPGPDCLKDVSYHVVVSFRANVQEMAIDSLKGMRGEYPSQLYLLSLIEVLQEYNGDELRDLISLPLALNSTQVKRFVERSVEMYWEYRGRYYFVSNNCATEAWNLLKSVVVDPWIQVAYVLSPLGMYDKLKFYGLTDDSILRDEKSALTQGYLFRSERPRLERAYLGIRDAAAKAGVDVFPAGGLDGYLKVSKAADRLAGFERLSAVISSQERMQLAARFFVLESYLLRSLQQSFVLRLSQAILDGSVRESDPDGKLSDRIVRLQGLLARLSPSALTQSGYGIPLEKDFRPAIREELETIRAEILKTSEEMREWIQKFHGAEYRELVETTENQKAFSRAMSRKP